MASTSGVVTGSLLVKGSRMERIIPAEGGGGKETDSGVLNRQWDG